MTAKEYLSQAHSLNEIIEADLIELDTLKDLSKSISSPNFEPRYETTRNIDPPFVKYLGRIVELENYINAEIDRYVNLKIQIHEVISQLKNADEKAVLTYRYIHDMTWSEIGRHLYIDESTAKRRHARGLEHIVLPDNPLTLKVEPK